MSQMDKPNINKLLLGQMVIAVIGIFSLLLTDFGGYKYRYVWGDVYLYEYYYLTRYYNLLSDTLSSILILIGVAGLLFAIYFATKNYRTKGTMQPDYFRGNATKSILGGVFTTVLAIIGAILIFTSGDDAFLDTGFYGAFFGGLITVGIGWQIKRIIDEKARTAQPIPQPTIQPIIQPEGKPGFCTVCGAPAGNTNFCQKCGARLRTDITSGMRYCMHCGSQISMEAAYCPKCGLMPPSGVEVKKCQKCGEIIPTIAKFCSKCGAGQSI